jgi:hypothetical protein
MGQESQERQSKNIEVLVIGGKHYPVYQFHKSPPDVCDGEHWHTSMTEVFPVDGNQGIKDPAPNACGFGKTGQIPLEKYPVTEEQIRKFPGLNWESL